MKSLITTRAHLFMMICVGLLLTSSLPSPASQSNQPEHEIRDLKRSSWVEKRRERSGATAAAKKRTSSRASLPYAIKEKMPNGVASPASSRDAEIGITIWRLRPSTNKDAIETRELIHPTKGGAKQEWTPVRAEADAYFHEDQMLRLTIESLRPGYLYVINRVQFADGSFGDPYLIFPTLRINGGRNYVKPRQTIRIPSPSDEIDFFELQRSRSRQGELQVSEELIIIIKPKPLEYFKTIPQEREPVTQQIVDELIARYATPFERAEMAGGAGHAITVSEKKAAENNSVLLDENDPYPQTIFRTAAKMDEAMLIVLKLKIQGK